MTLRLICCILWMKAFQVAELGRISMTTYKFDVTLVSLLIDYGGLPDALFSDPYESFEYNFCNFGGTEILYEASPCLKDGIISLPKGSSLVGLVWDSDAGQFEGSTLDYEIKTTSGDQNSGWNYTYHLLTTFAATVSADSLEEALQKVRDEALENLAIYDAGVNEVLEVEDVRLVHAHL